MGRLKTLEDWLNWQQNLHTQSIDLGLERIQKVYQKLFPTGHKFQTITVAGTNGKGSTCAFIDSIYQQSAFKSGKFSSPHLLNYNERFLIDGVAANDAQICTAFEKIEQVRGKVSLTYFEFSTLAALLIFTQHNVDVAILEVGLGGRLDSVNVVSSQLSIITNIAIDHTQYLGDTRAKIGQEKAGIMRPGVPCIYADSKPHAVIKRYADHIGAKLEFVSSPYLGKTGLTGEHQRRHAQSAVQAIAILNKNLPISRAQITKGIENTRLDGRFQSKHLHGKNFIFDVAHNPAAVQALSAELAQQPQPTLAIFSALKDKNIGLMIAAIRNNIDQWLLTPLDVERGLSAAELSQQFDLGDRIYVCNSAKHAVKLALKNPAYQRVVVFGSFYTVAHTIKVFEGLD